MSIHGQLTQPLQIRIRTCPPPVQRVFIVRSATNEWTGLPAGAYLNVMYKSFLEQIDREIARIELEPPAYSSLHNYYDIPKQKEMDARTIKALTAVLPAVYGYAMAQHSDEKTGRDGIALALSLTNLARDQRALAGTYSRLIYYGRLCFAFILSVRLYKSQLKFQ
ncbi:hypothetical protein FRX31_013273 [Thalictrum thalictroides]|uniref:Uncharacterized protein n=1 Tax=Thalictrum thalictroides TaxID=46969 RepID=A0A7J6WIE8_THATH|nr:hypothetical protein FRX31_013273 [Thalictrum thalictroides]